MENTFKRLAKGIKMILDSMKMNPIDNVIAELNTKKHLCKGEGQQLSYQQNPVCVCRV